MILEVNFGYLEPPDISNFFLGPIEFEITRFDCSVPKFMKCVSGLVDSLAVFKKSYPGLSSYKRKELARSILAATYGAHNAQEDVRMLSELIVQTNMGEKELSSLSFPPSAVHHQLLYNKEKADNISSLHPLMAKGVFKVASVA